jgi:hypothetical protein
VGEEVLFDVRKTLFKKHEISFLSLPFASSLIGQPEARLGGYMYGTKALLLPPLPETLPASAAASAKSKKKKKERKTPAPVEWITPRLPHFRHSPVPRSDSPAVPFIPTNPRDRGVATIGSIVPNGEDARGASVSVIRRRAPKVEGRGKDLQGDSGNAMMFIKKRKRAVSCLSLCVYVCVCVCVCQMSRRWRESAW